MSTPGMTKDADLAAVWLPSKQADRDVRTLVRQVVGDEKPIVGRGIEPDGPDMVLVSGVPGEANALASAEVLRRDSSELVPYWRRYPGDFAQRQRLDQAAYLFSVRVFAPPEWQQPIRDWLDQEHYERQTAMDGVFYCEGYEPLDGPFHLFNLWAIAHPDLIDSPEWVRVRGSSSYEEVLPGFQASEVRREIYRILDLNGD